MQKNKHGFVRITPHPGKDEYLIEITAVVDGLDLGQAPSKKAFLEAILAKVLFPGLVDEILGKLALARLIPKDKRRSLAQQYYEEAARDRIFPTLEGFRDFLQERGEDL
jgi:hypothetical protein